MGRKVSTVFDLSYDFRPESVFVNCTSRLIRFRVAEAFAIISIFVYGARSPWASSCCSAALSDAWICLGLNIVGAVTLGVVWASMSVAYTVDEMNCSMFSFEFHYGAGFALFVAAWALDVINIFVVVLSICTTASAESGQVEHKE
ncbi:Amastin surface glycoprotein, putative [Leishmania guyanensis]